MVIETNIEVVVIGDTVANDEVVVDYARPVGRIVSCEVFNSRRILSSSWDNICDASGDELRTARWIEDSPVVRAGIEDRLSIRCCRAVRNSTRRRTCYWCNLKLSNDLTLGNL